MSIQLNHRANTVSSGSNAETAGTRISFIDTGALRIVNGTSLQRPTSSSEQLGDFRYNTDSNFPEMWAGGTPAWRSLVTSSTDTINIAVSTASTGQTLVFDGTNWANSFISDLQNANGLIIDGARGGGADSYLEITADNDLVTISIGGTGTDPDLVLDTNGSGIVRGPSGYSISGSAPSYAFATKGYVDNVAAGLDVKQSVRVATISAGTLASSFENGDTVDGVVLATGDRILIKNQGTASENGIYIVAASGAPTRATDLPTSSSAAGVFVFVEEGTLADTGWVCTSNSGSDIVGTNNLTWSQFSSAGAYTAGDGLDLTGNEFDVLVSGTTIDFNGSNELIVDSSSTAGQILVSNGTTGTEAVYTTLTIPSTISARSVLVANSANTLVEVQSPDGSGNQILRYNDATNVFDFVSSSSFGLTDAFVTFTGDSGTDNASGNDTHAFTGATNGGIVTVTSSGGTTFAVDVNDLTSASANAAAADTFAAYDSSATATRKFTLAEIGAGINSAGYINVFSTITGDSGSDTASGADTHTLTGATNGGIVTVTSSGGTTFAVDVNDLASAGENVASGDLFVAYNTSAGATQKFTLAELSAGFSFLSNAFTSITGDSGSDTASGSDSHSLTGATNGGIVTVTSSGGTTFAVDVNDLTAASEDAAATDTFAGYNASGTATRKFTLAEIGAGINTAGYIRRIEDSSDRAAVDTTSTSGSVDIFVDTGSASDRIATFDYGVANTEFQFNNASGQIIISGGDGTGFGSGSTADIDVSLVPGADGKTRIAGGIAEWHGSFSTFGDAVSRSYILRANTTDNTQTEMLINGADRMALANDSTWFFEIMIVARRTDADNESASYIFKGSIDRNGNAASTALVNSVIEEIIAEDTSAWIVNVDADTTNGSLRIQVTGQNAKDIRWVAYAKTVQVIG